MSSLNSLSTAGTDAPPSTSQTSGVQGSSLRSAQSGSDQTNPTVVAGNGAKIVGEWLVWKAEMGERGHSAVVWRASVSWVYGGWRYEVQGHLPETEYPTKDAAKTEFEKRMRAAVEEEHGKNRELPGSSEYDETLSDKPLKAVVCVTRREREP
jgi:hypothetical protein